MGCRQPQAVLRQRLFPGNAVRGYDATISVAEQEFSGPGDGGRCQHWLPPTKRPRNRKWR